MAFDTILDAVQNKSNTRMCQDIFPFSDSVPERSITEGYPMRFVIDGGRMYVMDVVLWSLVNIEDLAHDRLVDLCCWAMDGFHHLIGMTP